MNTLIFIGIAVPILVFANVIGRVCMHICNRTTMHTHHYYNGPRKRTYSVIR